MRMRSRTAQALRGSNWGRFLVLPVVSQVQPPLPLPHKVAWAKLQADTTPFKARECSSLGLQIGYFLYPTSVRSTSVELVTLINSQSNRPRPTSSTGSVHEPLISCEYTLTAQFLPGRSGHDYLLKLAEWGSCCGTAEGNTGAARCGDVEEDLLVDTGMERPCPRVLIRSTACRSPFTVEVIGNSRFIIGYLPIVF
jgi:hypothetical protein